MLIKRVWYGWRQKAGESISGKVNRYYNLFHFLTPVQIKIGNELIETRPNACILSEPGQSRWFYFPEDASMNWIHLNRDAASLFEKYEIPLNCVFYPKDTGFVADAFRNMRMEFLSEAPYKEELLDHCFNEFLIKLSRTLSSGSAQVTFNSAERKKMEEMRGRMLSQPEKDWTVESMASSVSLSPSRFHAVYKELFGSSPMNDVIHARIDAAKVLLVTQPQSTLTELAEKLGYKNPYHFIRQFKSVTGSTPGAYRKNNR
jgi:AraC-like DNA-binding protein